MANPGTSMSILRLADGEATDELVDALLDMYRAVQEAVAGTDNNPRWVIGTHPAAHQLKEAAASGALFVAMAGGDIAGALIADRAPAPGYENVAWQVEAAPEEAAVVHLFAMHPAFRGKGLARPFLTAVEDILRDEGVRAVRLDTLVDNLGAQRTYEALGFANLGRACLSYGPGPYADDPDGGFVIFEKAL
ncbi:GNAT family N-acetyltransferase [Adlercreutzia sp. R25]|uniref:GNAT family N-acetyltransferase n=1 Tax=Adlercreutzia shanghongiae TaxID=3111773 RepID=A0ABU6IYC3_9ACTN|nr:MULTISPECIES: GNAT family N-acetyltransferase [unclassified Adlercreutzia]MEC4271850.1 GNAT family N-acetyltransferase [Adlercreutzia sp. R25]MEC4294857.1 GNAT family N-acetyltransferase [Adlercreutzia sp. R22]